MFPHDDTTQLRSRPRACIVPPQSLFTFSRLDFQQPSVSLASIAYAGLGTLQDHVGPVPVVLESLTFAYYTGWRTYSEILPLTWDRVDLEAGTVRLYRGTTKNKDGRVIHLPHVLQDILEQQWSVHLMQFSDCPYVFQREGQRIKNFRKAWASACREAGLVGKIPHDFRRTAVRNLVRAGVPERVAMMICGHKTRSVFDRYSIVSASDLEEAARRIDKAIETTPSTLSSPNSYPNSYPPAVSITTLQRETS